MRKRFWIITTLVFLLGLTAGAYLVLRSPASQGELINSTALSEGKSSDELLDELLKLNQTESQNQEYIPPENKNLTDDFLKTIIAQSSRGGQNISPDQIANSDFFASTILPYLKSNQLDLFPLIPDSVLNIVDDSKTTQSKYYKDTNANMVTFYNIMKTTLKMDPDNALNEDTLSQIDNEVGDLSSAFQNLSKVNVPKKLLDTHKEMLISVFSLQKFLEALSNSDADPLKSLLVVNDAEALGEFWKKTIYDYIQLPESKRK